MEIEPSSISTDSRGIRRGEFFIALKGHNFDGNNFVEEVFKKGAVGAILTTYNLRLTTYGKIVIQVKDTLKAMQDIAAAHREKFEIPVIAVTGSSGKTTVKDMIACVLSVKYNILKNEGTRNNHIGVPQTLLKLKPEHRICVLELGTNHKGEIRALAEIARPTIAVMTNIGPSHLEFLRDLDGVFEAKKEVIEFLDEKGILILNNDDKYLSRIKEKKPEILRYGFKTPAAFIAEALLPGKGTLTFVVNKKMVFELNLFGIHNIYNALAAITAASRFNISYKAMRKALFEYRPGSMRLDLKKINGIDIIDDSYNSNPLSMSKALEVIRDYPANARWVVSADMLELGREAVRFHREAGALVAKCGVEGLVTFGELSRHTLSQAIANGMPKERAWHCATHDKVADLLKKVTRKGDVVLLKGSRSMGMERVIKKLRS